MIKISLLTKKGNLKREGLILAHNFRVQSIMVGRAWQQEL